jgi:hypothetical protein
MKDENEIKLKQAYWSGVYYSLDPAQRHRSQKLQKMWLTSEIWLNVLNWVLGQATDSTTTIRLTGGDFKEWDS